MSGAECGVSEGWLRCEGGPGNASCASPPSADIFIIIRSSWFGVCGCRRPSVTVCPLHAQPRLRVCARLPALPCTYKLRSRIAATHESDVVNSDHHRHHHRHRHRHRHRRIRSAAIRRVGERARARRAPISSKTSTKLHVRFVRMCGGGSVPGRVYI